MTIIPARADQYPARLLADYIDVSTRRMPRSMAAMALRTQSLGARYLLAASSMGFDTTFDDVLRMANDSSVPMPALKDIRVHRWCDLARVIALQNILPEDRPNALAMYNRILDHGGPGKITNDHQIVHTQLALTLGDVESAEALLDRYRKIGPRNRHLLRLDLTNPFRGPSTMDQADWLAELGVLLPDGELYLEDGEDSSPFDRIAVRTTPVNDGPLVTIIVTAFEPDYQLLTSVKSLIKQTWQNLEILVMDDGSPAQFDAIFAECEAMDSRVSVTRLKSNAGTYAARNAGLDAARGEFVTFHDSDDWCHPRRVEDQVSALTNDPALVASVAHGLVADDNLAVVRLGRATSLRYTPSLLLRTSTVRDQLGYFDEVRKAADNEYIERITAVNGPKSLQSITHVNYTLVRPTPDSLSRNDFSAGWTHLARNAYRSCYRYWHGQIAAGDADPYLPKSPTPRPFATNAFIATGLGARYQPTTYDVVYAGDWESFAGPQKSMMEEIHALTRQGLRVAVMHMHPYRFMTVRRKHMVDPIVELINDGTVDCITLDEPATVKLLIIRYPPVLQFPPPFASALNAERVIIMANQPPSEGDGSDLRYIPDVCTENARAMFNVEPTWAPQGPQARAALIPWMDDTSLLGDDIPGIIDVDSNVTDRSRMRSDRPVIGRHGRDNWTKWPADRESLLAVYPDSPDFDVRHMGGAKMALALLEQPILPPNWVSYDYDEVSVREFLAQLDFYVYFPHPDRIEAFGRAIIEAIAAGCVAVLPSEFEETFGDAALYCEPAGVRELVMELYHDLDAYREQQRRGQQRVRERYSYEAHVKRVQRLLESK